MPFLRRRRARLIVAVVLLAVVVGLRIWLSVVGPLPGDRFALTHVFTQPKPRQAIYQLDSFYGVLGSPFAAAITVLAAAVALTRRDGNRAALGLAMAAGVVVVVTIMKATWGATPLWSTLRPHGGANYPSGHSAYAASVFGYLGLAARRHHQPELLALCLLGILGMGPALVAGGAHLVSDVVGGYLLGLAWLALVTVCFEAPGGLEASHRKRGHPPAS